MSRVEREKEAYDGGDVSEHSHRWHMRFEHVHHSPNTLRHEKIYDGLFKSGVAGKRCLEIGCNWGYLAAELHALGAEYVLGMDVSENALAEAQKLRVEGKLEFVLHDVHQPIAGTYDLIIGRAILHHVDYRAVLRRLYDQNLRPGGSLHFIEPLGANLLLKVYYKVAPKAHTPDERPFFPADLRWLRETFPGFRLMPMNYLSLPMGIVSSRIFSRPDNIWMRMADKADMWIAKNLPFMGPRFRSAIFTITKPA